MPSVFPNALQELAFAQEKGRTLWRGPFLERGVRGT
jgi:hypothetical protein